MEKMLASFLKAMGLSPEFIQSKMDEFTSIVKNYDARLARMEANQLKIMAALNIPVTEENSPQKLLDNKAA